MVTAAQFLAHLWGDYLLQSDWMAQNKTKAWWPAFVHACVYSLVFLIFRPSLLAFATILVTHFLIDRFRLARYVVWAKNWLGGKQRPFSECASTGYPSGTPDFIAFWLLIIADNVLHVTINALALRYL